MGYFKNNYKCEKCGASKFYIEFLDNEIKMICAICQHKIYQKIETQDKPRKSKRLDSTLVMISGKLEDLENKQDALIDKVEFLEKRISDLEEKK